MTKDFFASETKARIVFRRIMMLKHQVDILSLNIKKRSFYASLLPQESFFLIFHFEIFLAYYLFYNLPHYSTSASFSFLSLSLSLSTSVEASCFLVVLSRCVFKLLKSPKLAFVFDSRFFLICIRQDLFLVLFCLPIVRNLPPSKKNSPAKKQEEKK